MRAEIAKVRYLPMPRVAAMVAFAAAVLPGTLLLIFRPAQQSIYLLGTTVSFSLVVTVLAIALGTWLATLDFSSGTLQRTLTAEADRNRVLLAKLATVTALALVVIVGAGAVSLGITDIAMSRAGVADNDLLLRSLLSSTPDGLAGVWIGFGFGLLTRSMGGGLTLAIVFVFVANGFFAFIPQVEPWFYSSFTNGIDAWIGGDAVQTSSPDHGLAVSIVGTLAWTALVILPGWLAFTRADLK